jgi:hypothetical protein
MLIDLPSLSVGLFSQNVLICSPTKSVFNGPPYCSMTPFGIENLVSFSAPAVARKTTLSTCSSATCQCENAATTLQKSNSISSTDSWMHRSNRSVFNDAINWILHLVVHLNATHWEASRRMRIQSGNAVFVISYFDLSHFLSKR